MDLISAFKYIGFTKQEATLYMSLCKNGEMSGYELAKETGISRSNAYSSLSSLVEKGGAYLIQHKTKRYVAVPKEELFKNRRQELEENISYLEQHLSYNQPDHDPYITITGYENILQKITHIIEAATMRIYISGQKQDIESFKDTLDDAIQRGLKVVILSDEASSLSCTSYVSSEKDYTHFKLIVDTKEAISGTLSPGQALYSMNQTFVGIIKDAFINEIQLIQTQNKIN